MVFKFDNQSADHIDAYADTDWAGCPRSRRSTSCGCIMVGTHLLKCWGSTQARVAMSSGDAEFYGAVKGASSGLGMKALYRDIGHALPLRLWTDLQVCHVQWYQKAWRTLDDQTIVSTKSLALVQIHGVPKTPKPASAYQLWH